MNKTHLFGEMDLDLDLPFNKIFEKAFHCAESCGYMIDQYKQNMIKLYGTDNEIAVIYFKKGIVTKIMRAQYLDGGTLIVPWHEIQKGSYDPIG